MNRLFHNWLIWLNIYTQVLPNTEEKDLLTRLKMFPENQQAKAAETIRFGLIGHHLEPSSISSMLYSLKAVKSICLEKSYPIMLENKYQMYEQLFHES